MKEDLCSAEDGRWGRNAVPLVSVSSHLGWESYPLDRTCFPTHSCCIVTREVESAVVVQAEELD